MGGTGLRQKIPAVRRQLVKLDGRSVFLLSSHESGALGGASGAVRALCAFSVGAQSCAIGLGVLGGLPPSPPPAEDRFWGVFGNRSPLRPFRQPQCFLPWKPTPCTESLAWLLIRSRLGKRLSRWPVSDRMATENHSASLFIGSPGPKVGGGARRAAAAPDLVPRPYAHPPAWAPYPHALAWARGDFCASLWRPKRPWPLAPGPLRAWPSFLREPEPGHKVRDIIPVFGMKKLRHREIELICICWSRNRKRGSWNLKRLGPALTRLAGWLEHRPAHPRVAG